MGMKARTTTSTPTAVMFVMLVTVAMVTMVAMTGARGVAQELPFDVTDLRDRKTLTILVFGDAGTGDEGQHVRRCSMSVEPGDATSP